MMSQMLRLALFLALTLFSGISNAGDCRKTGSACVDSTPCKSISGVNVCLTSIGETCWQYQDTYECIEPASVDYCAPLVGAGCFQTSATCAETAFNGSCNRYTYTYQCSTDQGTPAGTIKLDGTYTIVKDELNTTQCDPYSSNTNCALAESVCVEGPETRVINGIEVYKDCWRYEDTYACAAGPASDCADLEARGCTQVDAQCLSYDDAGSCTMNERIYTCENRPAETKTVTDCAGQLYCADGNCFDSGNPADPDFAKVIAGMEAAREAGMYMDPNSLQIFKGTGGSCTKGWFGLKNCCKANSGGASMSNSYMLAAAKTFGTEAIRYGGSTYMYDTLFSSEMGSSIINAIYGGGSGSSYTFGGSGDVGFYGITVAIDPTGGLAFGFDPYSFAISIAVQIIMEMISCDQAEQVLAMKRGQNLCHYVGSYCSKKIPIIGTCLETKHTYCCFNSRLGRIIHDQGRSQLSKSWGSPKAPDCSGFTPEEFERLDFSKIDLTEFIAEIKPKTPNLSGMQTYNSSVVDQKVKNYYEQ